MIEKKAGVAMKNHCIPIQSVIERQRARMRCSSNNMA